MEKEYLTAKEAQKKYEISYMTIKRYVERGRLLREYRETSTGGLIPIYNIENLKKVFGPVKNLTL